MAMTPSTRFALRISIRGDSSISFVTPAQPCSSARQLQPQLPDGVWVVELSTIGDPALVPSVVAATVGLTVAPDASSEQVAADLGVAEITVKQHRRHIMRKMQASSLAELVKMVEKLT